MKEQFGTSQIKEMRFSKSEIAQIILENIKARVGTPYDFDYNRPLVIHTDDEIIFRFVQVRVTTEGEPRNFYLRPIKS